MKKISIIFGTRPEAIKLAPIILELKKSQSFDVNICVTAQHRKMLDQVLEVFDIRPDADLDIMKPNQTLSELTANAICAIDRYVVTFKPDLILVQGDTTTVFAATLVAFYHRIAVGHVEAGLRTWNRYSPFPEEINRVLTTKIAELHFAPTELSKQNLLKDNIPEKNIFVTGNPVIDALFLVKKQILETQKTYPGLEAIFGNTKPMVLITGHRRENFGNGFENICRAISILAQQHADTLFVYPVHLNPNVREPVNRILQNIANVLLIEPLEYRSFVAMMMRATIILTDSGGVQEEAPSLGKPVLVMRENTERPEAVDAGTVKLVGVDTERIVSEVNRLLTDKGEYQTMASAHNPYGDGFASRRILDAICAYFNE